MTSTLATQDLAYRAQAALYRYAWAADSGDLDTLRSLAVEDVVVTQAGETKHGMEPFLDIYRAFAASDVEVSRHIVTNVVASQEDGDGVRVDAYFEATLFSADSTSRIFGRYSDSMADLDGSVKLVHKRILVDRIMELPAATSAYVPYASRP